MALGEELQMVMWRVMQVRLVDTDNEDREIMAGWKQHSPVWDYFEFNYENGESKGIITANYMICGVKIKGIKSHKPNRGK